MSVPGLCENFLSTGRSGGTLKSYILEVVVLSTVAYWPTFGTLLRSEKLWYSKELFLQVVVVSTGAYRPA